MNIKIPDSWLREYLKTKAKPKEIAECLSLCGASVEKIIRQKNDSIYDIEITSNRVDMASVAGLAREAAAILPQFKINAKLKSYPCKQYSNTQDSKHKNIPVKVTIKDAKLCPRFTTVLLDNIKIKPSPNIIGQRLEKVGVRKLNNVIDISNYLMHEFGQPVHVFDYDKISKAVMILRQSKPGEKITTLDEKTYTVPGGDIVIEDGIGRLIDLCGIMGGANSAVDSKTKRVLLFVQNYEPNHIRRTSMTLPCRTEAASLFEKKIDPELVMPTLIAGIELIRRYANGRVRSRIIDIYPKPYRAKKLKFPLQLIKQRMGIEIQLIKVKKILTSLGFKISKLPITNYQLLITIPSWRANDISIPEDIIEEVARIYGYHNLPSVLPSGKLPKKLLNKEFYWEQKIKNLLKGWGLTEVYTYSMQSKKEILNFGFDPKNHLKIKNPLTKDWVYMRLSCIPSLLSVIAKNEAYQGQIKIFEITNIYNPRKNDLPQEEPHLVIAFSLPPRHPKRSEESPGELSDKTFFELKGLIEALLEELSIKFEFQKRTSCEGNHTRCEKNKGKLKTLNSKNLPKFNLFLEASTPGVKENESSPSTEAGGFQLGSASFLPASSPRTEPGGIRRRENKQQLGIFGQLKQELVKKFNISGNIFIANLDFKRITQLASDKKTYHPIPKYPPIIEDLTFEFQKPVYYTKVVSLIKKTSNLVHKIELIDQFKNKKTFRLYYQHPKRSLTDKEVGKVRKEIIQNLEKEGLRLVGQV